MKMLLICAASITALGVALLANSSLAFGQSNQSSMESNCLNSALRVTPPTTRPASDPDSPVSLAGALEQCRDSATAAR